MMRKSRPALLLAALLGTAFMLSAPAMIVDGDRGVLLTGRDDSARASAPAMGADKGPSVSRDVGQHLQDAIKALNAKDYKTALAAVQAAQGVSGQSDYDKFKINEFLSIVYNDMDDKVSAEAPAAAAANSTVVPDSEKPEIYIRAMVLAEDNKHYDQAIKFGKQFEALGKPDSRVTEELLQAYMNAGDTADTAIYVKKVKDAEIAAGKMPDQALLDTEFNMKIKAHDQDGAAQVLLELAIDYNESRDWSQLLDVVFATKGLREKDIVHLGRLFFATGAPVPPDDANFIAEATNHLGYYGDAQTAVDKGAKPVPGLAGKVAADKKSLGQQIAAGPKQGGQYNLKLAEALYGYGRYADAETAARAAIAKGDVADPSDVQLVLGEALFSQGKYAEAAQTFAGVKGGGPATGRIASIWQQYAQVKARPATAAAPAAQ